MEEEGNKGARQLRNIVVKEEVQQEENHALVPIGPKFNKREGRLATLAMQMGFQIVRTDKMKGLLATAIASRLTARSGEFVYQCTVFSLTNLTLGFLDSVLPESAVCEVTSDMKKWSMLTTSSVNNFLSPFLGRYQEGYCCTGSSRALKTLCHPWIRLVAVCYQLVITFYECKSRDVTSITVTYALLDQNGELHPPKDLNRIEMALDAADSTAIRQQAMADCISFHKMGAPLSGGFLRQMGLDNEAMVVEAMQANAVAESSSSSQGSGGQPKKKSKTMKAAKVWNVNRIVGAETVGGVRGYWVEWEGYHPSWEAWRVEGRGGIGTPLVTWEPGWELRGNRALEEFQDGPSDIMSEML